MITLRQDQMDAVRQVAVALHNHSAVLFQAETGWGKTVFASFIAQQYHAANRKLVFAVHRKELLYQTSATFTRFGIPHGIIASGSSRDPFEPIQIASADTLKNRRGYLKAALLIPDEAHLWAAETRQSMIHEAKHLGTKILGLTATPERLDGRPLGVSRDKYGAPVSELFETLICGPPTSWLMEQKFLSEYRIFEGVRMDTKGLHTKMGDYVIGEMEDRFIGQAVIGDCVRGYRQFADGLRCMTFAFSRKHGAALTETYNANGIPAVYIDGTTDKDARRAAVVKFADGDAKVLVSVNLCIEGFDLSSQVGRDVPVEAISFQRPMQSLAMWRQMTGRGLRPKGYPAVLMDHVRGFETHGLPDDAIEWSLDGKGKRKADKKQSLTTCGTCFYMGPKFRVCPNCGAEEKPGEGRAVEEVDGDLVEVDIAARKAKREAALAAIALKSDQAAKIVELAQVAAKKDYRKVWIVYRCKDSGLFPEGWEPSKTDWITINRALAASMINA